MAGLRHGKLLYNPLPWPLSSVVVSRRLIIAWSLVQTQQGATIHNKALANKPANLFFLFPLNWEQVMGQVFFPSDSDG